MIELKVCPSTLAEGFDGYSPVALKTLFDGKVISPYLTVPSPSADNVETKEAIRNIGRISLSGVQSKFAVVIGDDLHLRYAAVGEQGTYILYFARDEFVHFAKRQVVLTLSLKYILLCR